ncbi:MAG: hypothetical protein F4Y07_16470 [Gemmatimonadetes bacterium]|nr:hypothetical protein [Gemmatimonadota bacterium]MYE18065.1 hypothetical protein [Gemmatimonadota bacterium]
MDDTSGPSYKLQALAPDALEMVPEWLPYVGPAGRVIWWSIKKAVVRAKLNRLLGTYELQSLSALVTGGRTMETPDVSGTLTLGRLALRQGTMSMRITLPDGLGGTVTVSDVGTYTIRPDGTWEQNGKLVQAEGAYSLEKDMLTVETVRPKLNGATIRWKRAQGSR